MARNIYNMMAGTDEIVIQWNNPDIAGLNELARLLEWSYNMLNTEPSNNTAKTLQLLCAFHLLVFKSLEIFTKNDQSLGNFFEKFRNGREYKKHEKAYNQQKDLFRKTWKIDFFDENAPYSTKIGGVVMAHPDKMNENARQIIAETFKIMRDPSMKERVREQYATHDQTFYNNWSRIFYTIHKKWPCYKGLQPISIQLPANHKLYNTDEFKLLGEILDRINGSTEFDPLHDCTSIEELDKYGKAFQTLIKFSTFTKHNNTRGEIMTKISHFMTKYCLKSGSKTHACASGFLTLVKPKSIMLNLNAKVNRNHINNRNLAEAKKTYHDSLKTQFNAYTQRCNDSKQTPTLSHTSVIETPVETYSTNDWEEVTPEGTTIGGRRRTRRRKIRRRTRRSK